MSYFTGFVLMLMGIGVGWFVGNLLIKRKIGRLILNEQKVRQLLGVANEKLELAQQGREQLEEKLQLANERIESLLQTLSRTETQLEHANDTAQLRAADIEQMHQKMKLEFAQLAQQALKQNEREANLSQRAGLQQMLEPLQVKIKDFEKKVEDTYEKSLRDRSDLKIELKYLRELNVQVSQETINLTNALKGDVKKQGNWGELVLERIVEKSGLRRGIEFEMQYDAKNDAGKKCRPDMVVYLPDNKHLIVDSKVSLVAWYKYLSSTTDSEQQLHIKAHIQSIRAHVKGLGEKSYQGLAPLNSPDFVLLFMPIEAAFGGALQADPELFSFAWDHNIVIVSPTTLLATMRTISSIWKQENQARNAREIARQSGALYDKLIGFITDFEKVGERLEQARTVWADAKNKLHTGRGNLVSRAENIRQLGAENKKQLPENYQNSEFVS